MSTNTINPKELLEALKCFNGSEQLFAHNLAGKLFIKITEGIKYLAETANCYWLLDIILSYQFKQDMKDQPVQVWKLTKQQSNWLVRATDGNQNELITQVIAYSDFPLDEITIWLIDEVAMLPSEY